tara:strand:- start:8 stop:313 length:306 start_codon:yes stop_codon:yes gene_type:complete
MNFSDYKNLEIELPKNPVDSGEFDIDNEDLKDDDEYLESEDSNGNSLSVDVSKTLKANKELLEHPFYKNLNEDLDDDDDLDYEPTDEEMMSNFGVKWHDYL